MVSPDISDEVKLAVPLLSHNLFCFKFDIKSLLYILDIVEIFFMSVHNDTIIAQATPPGKGGVGIIRISGQHCQKVANQIIKQPLKSRVATFTPFYDLNNNVIDQGIAIFFKSPNSFTGEDILELQGHGGQVLLDLIIQNILKIASTEVSAMFQIPKFQNLRIPVF